MSSSRCARRVPVGTFQNKSAVDGASRLFAYRQLTSYPGMVLVVGLEMEEVLAPWWHMAWIAASTWVVAMLVVGALILWLTHEWERHGDTQARYRQLFDASPYPTVALDRDTRRFLAVNDIAVAQSGWSREEMLEMSSNDLYPPEDLLKVAALRRQPHADGVTDLRGLRHRKKDGTLIDVSMTLRPIDIDGRPGFLATAEDITDQLRGEKARQEVPTRRGRKPTWPARFPKRHARWPKASFASRRRWRPWASSPAASRTTSTTSSW